MGIVLLREFSRLGGTGADVSQRLRQPMGRAFSPYASHLPYMGLRPMLVWGAPLALRNGFFAGHGNSGSALVRAGDFLPDFGVDWDAEAEVFFAELEGLFAGVADRFGGVGGGGVVEVVDDGVGDVGEFGRAGYVGWVDGEEELGLAGLAEGIGWELVGGEAAGEHSGHHVEDEGQAGALPVADGESSLGGFDGGGVAGEVAFDVEAAVDGEGLVALAVGGEGPVGELGHGHVEDDVTAWRGGWR